LKLPVWYLLSGVVQTCRRWKTIVDNSIKLQQHLFFKPISPPTPRYFDDEWVPEFAFTGRWATFEEERFQYIVYEHPILREWLGGNEGDIPEIYINWTAVRRPEASWRRALATQPPVKIMTYTDNSSEPTRRFQNDGGVTLQDFESGNLELKTFDSEKLDGVCELLEYEGYYQWEALRSKPHEPWAGPMWSLDDQGNVIYREGEKTEIMYRF
jgi:hypothetical protein